MSGTSGRGVVRALHFPCPWMGTLPAHFRLPIPTANPASGPIVHKVAFWNLLGRWGTAAVHWGPVLRYLGLAAFAAVMVAAQRRLRDGTEPAMYCSYGDGSLISDPSVDALRTAIWNHLVFPRWQRGDVLVIDNRAIGHGRMPYRGSRRVVVAWA